MQNRVPLTLGGQFYMSWDMLLALIMRSARPLLCNQSLGYLSTADDDIQGVSLLYGGLSNCKVMDLKFGKTSNALAESDCNVKELTVWGKMRAESIYIDLS